MSSYWAIVLAFFTPVAYAQNITVQDMIREYFPDNYVTMELIAACESSLSQKARGLIGEIGLLQINPNHLDEARSMGIDVYTVRGNLEYGRYLLQQNGLQPWRGSRDCWAGKN